MPDPDDPFGSDDEPHPTRDVGPPEPMPEEIEEPYFDPGTRVGEYVILGNLAEGGFGSVYRAEHATTKQRAALKVLHADMATSEEMVERFVREVQAVRRIGHPNIVEIYQLDRLPDERPFYAMELIDGTDLASLVRREGRLEPREALEIIAQICAALEAAHAAGIVHRDLKAANILVEKRGDGRRAKLLDFGIAKLIDKDPSTPGLTTAGRQLGTPIAMAPEQIRGFAVDARTDIYALGILLFYVLTTRYPFLASDWVQLERMHLEAPPPRPSSFAPIPPAVDAIVLRCLEKDPAQRFSSALEVSEALRAALGDARGGGAMRPAIGVYVQVRHEETEELDDALLEDLGYAMDMIEAALRDAGLSLPLVGSGEVLAALPLPDDAAQVAEARAMIERLTDELDRSLEGRPTADRRVRISFAIHVADATVRAPAEVVGGPLLDLNRWPTARGRRAP